MRTITPGAARRRETTEAVRERMAHLFDVAMRVEPPSSASPSSASPSSVGLSSASALAISPAAPVGSAPSDADPDPPTVEQAHAVEAIVDDDLSDPFRSDPLLEAPPGPRGLRGLLGRIHPGLLPDRRAMVGLGVLLVLAIGYAVQHFWLGRPHPVAVPTALTSVEPGPSGPARGAGEQPGPTVVVDVAGKVQHPGLLTLPTGSRVADAVRAAGGALAGTDTDALNLARLVNDGEQVLVGAPAPAELPGVPGRPTPVSINQGTADQLDALPGVGPALAQRIVQYRHQHGPFRTLDQLRRISGIGERKYQDLKPLITL